MREQIVAEARKWIGTPFIHQGHLRGVGCDCAGLVGGVAVSLGLVQSDFWDRFSYSGYGRQPDGHSFISACREYMVEIDTKDAIQGDTVAMRFARLPQHIGILSGESIIHALSRPGYVAEHRLDNRWRKRVMHAFRLPGVA